jgi:hypothetical protein
MLHLLQGISFINIITALSIALIIVIISLVKNSTIKAIVYGLPIPITLATIALQRGVDTTHIIGLFLLTGFLWLVYKLNQMKIGIYTSNILASIAYVVLGYFFINFIDTNGTTFGILCASYFILWLIFVLRVDFSKQKSNISKRKKVSVFVKGPTVFVVANFLLFMKNLLGGIITTFPFSGVFTVVEMRDDLEVLSKEFTKNSVAILAFFIVLYFTYEHIGIYYSVLVGWLIYFLTLSFVRKVFN